MPDDKPPQKPLICPACFAREIDPVFLNHDPEDGGEYYCTHCNYTAPDRESVKAFLSDFLYHRHGVARPS